MSGKPDNQRLSSNPGLPFRSATALTFAGVFPLAAIVTRLTTALAFTFVLTLAPVLALFGIGHSLGLQRNAGVRSHGACRIGTNREGTCQ